jgi:iron(II)-dependent oxidoreductase
MRTQERVRAPDAATAADLRAWTEEARARTLAFFADLSDDRLLGPHLPEVNPPLWEVGHVAWFQERWVLRHAAGRSPLRADGDAIYDSSSVAHSVRWSLPLPSRRETLGYLEAVRDRVLAVLDETPDERALHFARYAVHHEDMHQEAFFQSRQLLGWHAPAALGAPGSCEGAGDSVEGDVTVAGGTVRLGAERDAPFVFDNEKWAHDVEVPAFRIARRAVTEGEMLAFVEDGGYENESLWTADGWAWRRRADAHMPRYWRRTSGGWERRWFDRWDGLDPRRAVVNVCAHEVDAWCRWAGRRLPTEAEWECAATAASTAPAPRPLHPWGDEACTRERANVDGACRGPVSVDAFGAGDGATGCRQLTGNVWEWTSTPFTPHPGFVEDAYRDYSLPWFGTHRVLRGGSWATRGRMLRNTLRNFYTPDRRDVFAGFRTCARS